jgi:hypothetical protein
MANLLVINSLVLCTACLPCVPLLGCFHLPTVKPAARGGCQVCLDAKPAESGFSKVLNSGRFWQSHCTTAGQGAFMTGQPCNHQGPFSRCEILVPRELDSVGLCVLHFTLKIEQNCTEMHRQIALGGATQDRQAAVTVYIVECASLLARIASNQCLSDDLKRRILSTFLSLMNLRDKIAHPASYPEPRSVRRAFVAAQAAVAS